VVFRPAHQRDHGLKIEQEERRPWNRLHTDRLLHMCPFPGLSSGWKLQVFPLP